EEDGVVRQELEVRVGRGESGRERRMAMDDRAHVRARLVDLRVQHRLEVQRRVGVVDRDHVVGADLVERDPLPLYVDVVAVPVADADVPERQVGVALERQDAAGPRRLLAERPRGDGDTHLRSVGGYAGCGKPKTMNTSSGPVFTTACQTPAGMCKASPS